MNNQTQEALKMLLDLIPNEEAKRFWKETYQNGITLQELANELSDMHIMIENVPKIVNAVTGGLLSYATYPADTVIAKFNDYVDDIVQEAIKEALADAEKQEPVTRDWKKTIDERIAKDDDFKKALAEAINQEIGDYEIKAMLDDIEWYQQEQRKLTDRIKELEKKEWQSLSDDEIELICGISRDGNFWNLCVDIARAIEQSLKELNAKK